jgi:hypothetical protein
MSARRHREGELSSEFVPSIKKQVIQHVQHGPSEDGASYSNSKPIPAYPILSTVAQIGIQKSVRLKNGGYAHKEKAYEN